MMANVEGNCKTLQNLVVVHLTMEIVGIYSYYFGIWVKVSMVHTYMMA